MRSRQSIMKTKRPDYEYEATRPMCAGCNKVHGEGVTLLGYVCTMWNAQVKPSMYLRADECPHNPRKRPPMNSKIRVGQGKTRQGGNR